MNKSSFTLSRGWHIPAALVLTCVIALPALDVALGSVSRLRLADHTALAGYYAAIAGAIWGSTLLILLPRTGNMSSFAFVRTLGRLNLLVRYFVAGGVAICLFLIGALLEKYAA